MWAGQGRILPLVKRLHFFLGPWLLVRQFIEISDHLFKTVCGAARFPERHLPPKDPVAQMFYEVHSEERYVKSMPRD